MLTKKGNREGECTFCDLFAIKLSRARVHLIRSRLRWKDEKSGSIRTIEKSWFTLNTRRATFSSTGVRKSPRCIKEVKRWSSDDINEIGTGIEMSYIEWEKFFQQLKKKKYNKIIRPNCQQFFANLHIFLKIMINDKWWPSMVAANIIIEISGIVWYPALVSPFFTKGARSLILRRAAFNVACLVAM